jgi:thiamine biosynthesis lipoprotein
MHFSNAKSLLGTVVEITIVSNDVRTPERMDYVFDYFASIEQEFSRFQPDSALSILNRDKISKVSSRFIALMKLCEQKYRSTLGLFNPLVRVAGLGYSHSFDEGKFERSREAIDTDFKKILIGTDRISLGEYQSLDFWGIAKWYAVDMASAMLLAFGYDNFFVNAWGDIFAHGVNGEWNLWTIGIENPFSLVIDISIALNNAAVATSGRYKRKWNIGGKEFHHLVDPLSWENRSSIMSVTLVGKKCVDCDSFTKSIFHLSPETGIQKIQEFQMEGLIYTLDGRLIYTPGMLEKYGLTFGESE